ncbi:phosphoserine phosphatase [Capsaspora owczarzaki ATCC 30864]|uniref:phosphoserine phosphatase n=1 Tax=Capsaspora owczarzaki (strain ATCC 30864) TaxID=595528 RepID=A0A0D2WHX8_CAPO3|nr:phosphoserine phosphatase [Capsaspora owczarzaki ATCC 30864]KJE89325.1 phosphoserine phosphatase [Capsaspora owczarzaki ATCC 30864]|eukprot:XP_004365692.1 phosphoserine phosphatase [Capsaspora owczarzaki ATCC 30864]
MVAPADSIVHLLKSARCVVFDVDSTLIQEEGIDVLADFCGVGKQVAELTSQAMGGAVPFQVALKQRLDLIKPSAQNIHDCLQQHPPHLTSGVKELVEMLKACGVDVYVVTGGFRQMIAPVIDELEIAADHVFANQILFENETGSYAGFDDKALTSQSGGKGKAVALIKAKHENAVTIMVGDGITDLEARPPADMFIGFGGNVRRQAVQERADWFVTSFSEVIAALQ